MKFLDAVRIAIQSFLSLPLFGDRLWVTSSWFKGALDEDWEVEEKSIPLTASLFDSKAELVLSRWKYSRFDDAPDAVRLAIADLRKELGL